MENGILYVIVGLVGGWVPGLVSLVFDYIKTEVAAKRAEKKEQETLRRDFLKKRVDELRNYVQKLNEAISDHALTEADHQKMVYSVEESLPYWIARGSIASYADKLGKPGLANAVQELIALAKESDKTIRSGIKNPSKKEEIAKHLSGLYGQIMADLDWAMVYSKYPEETLQGRNKRATRRKG